MNSTLAHKLLTGTMAAALLLPISCATSKPEMTGPATEGANTVQCLLSGPQSRADARYGVYYEDRHGIYYEPCVSSDGRSFNHYAYWDGSAYALLGNNETHIDPLGLDKEPQRGGIAFYEIPERKVTCEGNRCQAESLLYNIKDGSTQKLSLDWVACKVSDTMEVMDFSAGTFTVACASYRVKGETCRQAVGTLKALVERKHYPLPERLELSDKWCE